MKRLILIVFSLSVFSSCFCQNEKNDSIAMKLYEYMTAGKSEQLESYFIDNRESLDKMTDDILVTIINLGKYAQNMPFNQDSTINCIKRITQVFNEHKEEVKNLSFEYMTYFNLYIPFLCKIGSHEYLNIYKTFKEIWPLIDKSYSEIYINILEYVSLQAIEDAHYTEAASIFEELIDLSNQGYKVSSESFIYYYMLGICYQNIGEEEKAIIMLDNSLVNISAKERIEQTEAYISIIRQRFELATKMAQLSRARELGEELVAYYENKKNHKQDLIDVSIRLAELELRTFNAKDGIYYYEKGMKEILASSNYDESEKKNYLADLYVVYNNFEVNENDRKFRSYKEKYNIQDIRTNKNRELDEQYVESLWNVVNHFNWNTEPDYYSYATSILYLSQYYGSRKQELYAVKIIEDAIALFQKHNVGEQHYALLYSALGNIYTNFQDYDKVIEYCKKAQQIYNINRMYNAEYVDILCNLAKAYCFNGDLIFSKIFIEEAINLVNSTSGIKNDKNRYHNILNCFSTVFKFLGEEEKALSFNEMILDDFSDNENNDMKKIFELFKLDILLYFNRFQEADEVIKSIGYTYFDNSNIWWPLFETNYFNDRPCEIELEKINKWSRDEIKRLYSSVSSNGLKEYWDTYGGSLNLAYSMALSKYNTPSLRSSTYNNLLFTKKFQLEISKYFRDNSNENVKADFYNQIEDNISNVEEIKKLLKNNDVAIEFFIAKKRPKYTEYENKYGALIMRKDLVSPVYVELCDCDSLNLFVYSNTIGEAEEYASKYYNISNSDIYNLIWKPLEKEVPMQSHVYISGCGATLFVNFSALSNGKERLGNLYDIHNVFSTSDIKSLKNKDFQYHNAILYGGIDYNTPIEIMTTESQEYTNNTDANDFASYRGIGERGAWGNLQYSKEEVDSIEDVLSKKGFLVSKYEDTKATEESFKALSGKSPDIIHISTHGFFYQPYMQSFRSDYKNYYYSNKTSDNLLYNGLLFSGANNAWAKNILIDGVEDGVLTAKEISSLDLSRTDLVTLSACQTGLGESNDTDGNEGLIRAFKIAGVKNIINTLWSVSDSETSYFMKIFYKNLLETDNPKSALDKTVNFIKKELPDPYYWAPFILVE